MNQAKLAVRNYFIAILEGWDRFWFKPTDPATLSLIRICAGAMLFYTHLVWTIDLEAFFGPGGWIPRSSVQEAVGQGAPQTAFWSYFWLIESSTVLWAVHIAALVVFALLTLGYKSRLMAVLAYLIAVSYVHRVPSAFFGLDKVNCMLAMYLMLGPSGARYSLDHWLRRRREGGKLVPVDESVGANVAIRMLQLHMCIIYLFGGLDKLQGETWWNGTAMWMGLANLEYQSMDMTWMASWPKLCALLTHVTIFWEVFYIALVWNKMTRPVVLFLAVAVHGGIALFLGMITFGLAMIIGNMAFLSPALVRAVLERKQSEAPGETGA